MIQLRIEVEKEAFSPTKRFSYLRFKVRLMGDRPIVLWSKLSRNTNKKTSGRPGRVKQSTTGDTMRRLPYATYEASVERVAEDSLRRPGRPTKHETLERIEFVTNLLQGRLYKRDIVKAERRRWPNLPLVQHRAVFSSR
jgi:hypothetical protein